jgi:valyl-tRNA synthetase
LCLTLHKGRVDLSSHLEKTEEKLAKSKDKLNKLRDQMDASGYMDKVSPDVKEADEERFKNLSAEVETLGSFVVSLRKLATQ